MKHDSLTAIEETLIGEGMSPDAARKMLAVFDSTAANTPTVLARQEFVERFWAERKRPTVATEVAGGRPDEDELDSIGEIPPPLPWPEPDPEPDDQLDLGDGTHIYLEDLVLWLGEQAWSDFCLDLARFYRERSYLTKRQTEAAISTLVKTAKKREIAPAALVAVTIDSLSSPAPATAVEPGKVFPSTKPSTPGIYVSEGELYRVRWNRAHSHLYVEQIIVDEATDTVEYEYRPGMLKMLDATRRIDASMAASFGMTYGRCVFCGRRLTTSASIDVGYGPVCAAANGLPHGEEITLTTAEMVALGEGDDPDDGPVLDYWIDVDPGMTGKVIPVIKEVRSFMDIGLKEAKDLVVGGSIGPLATITQAEALSAKIMHNLESLKIAQR